MSDAITCYPEEGRVNGRKFEVFWFCSGFESFLPSHG